MPLARKRMSIPLVLMVMVSISLPVIRCCSSDL